MVFGFFFITANLKARGVSLLREYHLKEKTHAYTQNTVFTERPRKEKK